MLAKKALGATAAAEKLYVEDVYSTYLYSGTGSSQTITNNVDLSANGGLVWFKHRSGPNGPANHQLYDTARGVQKKLATNTTSAEATETTGLTAFNTNGFTFGSDGNINASSSDVYASFTFRKAEKFFDVVTYTGNGSASRQISHNLGSTPGCIIVKATSTDGNWAVWHTALADEYRLFLNLDLAQLNSNATTWFGTDAQQTSTYFTLGSSGATQNLNTNGVTYVAYLFAHDAGGFGDSGSDSVIKCGSYSGAPNTINLGWEPQWILLKNASAVGNWIVVDNMRGMPVGGNTIGLYPNLSNAESSVGNLINITPTGFTSELDGTNIIYIAIRRGPMKTPESGTEVFSANAVNSALDTKITTNFPIDLQITKFQRDSGTVTNAVFDRLRGVSSNSTEVARFLATPSTAAETATSTTTTTRGFDNTGFRVQDWYANTASIYWNFKRAPGFFDVVCYTGDGVAGRNISHNLGVAPELIIAKSRTAAVNWEVLHTGIPASLRLNSTNAGTSPPLVLVFGNNTSYIAPTSTVFTVGTNGTINSSASTYVAYLFATVPGVSKVGSYTGTGTTLQVNCGFTSGARFVLIKRTDSTGDWYVWDSARGIVAGNDPYLLLNSTAAEVTNTDYIDTYSSGFEISSTAPAAINANGGTFIYLAIA